MSRRSRSAAATPPDDGKVRVSCPQCGTLFRVAEDVLDSKIECSECHRVFLARNTVGKRVAPPSHTKAYAIFGVVALLLVVSLVALMNKGNKGPAGPVAAAPDKAKKAPTRTNHPRAQQLLTWAQAMGNDNRLVILTHNDTVALQKRFQVAPGDRDALCAAILKNDSTKVLREMHAESASLADDASMTGKTGKGRIFLTRPAGTDVYAEGATGEYEVEFRMDGEQIKVTDWTLVVQPARNTKR